jgi:CheY-like chemotaxis protein
MIVSITSNSRHGGDMGRCRAAGMHRYLSKPLYPKALFAVIEEAVLNPKVNQRV